MTKEMTFYPSGVCSRQYDIKVRDDVVENIEIIGGCNGNLQGITRLLCGRKVDEVIDLLKGIECGQRATSCPDQISRALMQMKESE